MPTRVAQLSPEGAAVETEQSVTSPLISVCGIFISPMSAVSAAEDQNTDTLNVDTDATALAATALEFPIAGTLGSLALPVSLAFLPSEAADGFAPLLAVVPDAAGSAEADSVFPGESLLDRCLVAAWMSGDYFLVDDENPSPLFMELTKSRQRNPLPLTGPAAMSDVSVEQTYVEHQMDMSSNGEHSSLASDVEWFYQPDTPPERKVDDAATSSLAGAYEELNEVMDVAIHTALGEATDAPMDASWAVTAGEYRAAPGSCNFLNVVVLMPEDRTVAIVCSVHCEWVKSPKNHVAKKHIGVEFPPELFANFNICKLWPNFESAPLALPCVAEQSGVRCPASNKITLHASSLKCCNSRHSPESLLSVTVQSLGEGSWLQAVEVVSRGHAAANPDAGTARENRRLAISNARSAPLLAAHTNRRKVSPMYQKLNWY